MQLIDGKKIFLVVLLSAICFFLTTCRKKIAKYPFDMTGVWYGSDTYLNGTVLVIETNGDGKIFTYNPTGGITTSFDINEKGKVKYRKDVLYIGNKKFDIFNEPVEVTTPDSIKAPDENDFTSEKLKKRKVLARMTIQKKGLFSFKEVYTLSKYVDY